MSSSTRKRSLPAEVPQAKQKQARTSQSCGPCRARVSRCDKQRPCSSCILANTQGQCYPDVASYKPPPSYLVSRALSRRGSQTHRILGAPMGRRGSSGQQLYEGPTAVLMTLAPLKDGSPEVPPAEPLPERARKPYRPDKDLDVLSKLPPRDVCERVVDYYFEHCTWLFKYFDRRAFAERLSRWRTDEETDSLTLAGVAVICAIVVHCLPPHHELASTLNVFPNYKPLPAGADEKDIQSARERAHADSSVNRAGVIGAQFYDACELALERQKAGSKVHVWTMDFLEIILGKCHYLSLSRVDTEELWALRGELVSMATALGLHRYPGKNVPQQVAERHRWIWGNIIFLERWQALMHGRPISILPEHFDVALPSPEAIPLPTQTGHHHDAQHSLDLSRDPSAVTSSHGPDQSLMTSLSRHGRTDSMPNISRLGLDSAEPLASHAELEEGTSTSVVGPSLEDWTPSAGSTQPSSDPKTTGHMPNPFALSLDPHSLLLDPAQEAQMFGTLPPLTGISEDIPETGWNTTWDLDKDDLSSWDAMMNQSPIAFRQEDDPGNILRALPGPEECGTRTYEAHVAHFHLSHILGRITETLLSLRPVAYACIQARDDELQHFLDTLAPSLRLSAEDIAQHLVSQHTGLRRRGVQVLVVKMAVLHIRFMLHRPYAIGEVEDWPLRPSQNLSSMASSKGRGRQSEVEAFVEAREEREYRREVRSRADEHATSLAKAIEAAEELIDLAVITVPKMTHANACAEHAHLNWAPVQVTAAALFLINVVVTSHVPQTHEDCVVEPAMLQPISASSSASSNSNLSYPTLNAFILLPIIRRALRFLQDIAYVSTAHNSASLLQHLEPLFTESFVLSSKEKRIKIKRETLMNVERLNMPYRDGGTVGIVGGVSPPAPLSPSGLGQGAQTPAINPSILQDTRRSSDASVSRTHPAPSTSTLSRTTQATRSASLQKAPPRISATNAIRTHVHFAPSPPRTRGDSVSQVAATVSGAPDMQSQTATAPASAQIASVSATATPAHITTFPPPVASSSTQTASQGPPQLAAPSTARGAHQATEPSRERGSLLRSRVPPTALTEAISYPSLNTAPALRAASSGISPPAPSTTASVAPPFSQPPPAYNQTSMVSAYPAPSPSLPHEFHTQTPVQTPQNWPLQGAPFAQSQPLYTPSGLPPTSSAFSNLSHSTFQPPSNPASAQNATILGEQPPSRPYVPNQSVPLSGYAIFSGYPNAQSPFQNPHAPPSTAGYTHGGRLGYPPGFNMNNVYGASSGATPSNATQSFNGPTPTPPTHVVPPAPSTVQADTSARTHDSAMWFPQATPAPLMMADPAPPFPSGDTFGSSFWTNMTGQRVGEYDQPSVQQGHNQQSFPQGQLPYAQPSTQDPGQPAPPYGQQNTPNYQAARSQQGYTQGHPVYGQPGLQMSGQQASPYGQQGQPIVQGGYGQLGLTHGPPTYGHPSMQQAAYYAQPGAQQPGPQLQPGVLSQSQQFPGSVAYVGMGPGVTPTGYNYAFNGQGSALEGSGQAFSGPPAPFAGPPPSSSQQ